MTKVAIVCIVSALVCGCTSTQQVSLPRWEAPLNRSHPLAGSVWNVAEGRSVSPVDLLQVLSQADYALLGEKHDNPDHHLLQAYVLRQLRERGALASVSFEMLDSSQQDSLASVTAAVLQSPDALKVHLQWDEAGWNWEYYGPMLYELLQKEVAVRIGNISSDEMMAIYGGEAREAIKDVLSQEQLQRLEQEIDESHCGMLPASQFASMLRVQQSRDAQMAASLESGAQTGAGVNVLVAGNFHARRDLGVPNYILGKSNLISLAFIELSEESNDPLEYVEALQPGSPYDYLWFTPAVEAQDYCADLRADAAA